MIRATLDVRISGSTASVTVIPTATATPLSTPATATPPSVIDDQTDRATAAIAGDPA